MQESPAVGEQGRRVALSRVLAVSAALALGAAACGGSSKASSSSSSSSSSTSAAQASATTTTAAPPTSAAAVGGGNFCQLASTVQKDDADISAPAALSPATLESEYKNFQAEEGTILAAAPSQIKSQLQAILNFDNEFLSQLAKVNYSFTALPPSFLESLGSQATALRPDFTALSSYLSTTCGISVTPTTAAP